jgi:hypothetical protein
MKRKMAKRKQRVKSKVFLPPSPSPYPGRNKLLTYLYPSLTTAFIDHSTWSTMGKNISNEIS